MPGKCICESITPLPVYNPLAESEPLFWLARESAFLVNSNGTGRKDICAELMNSAIRQGFVRRGYVNYIKLAVAIESRFGEEVLSQIGVKVWDGERPSSWLRRMFYAERYHRKGCSLLRLLVIGTVFDSVKSYETAQPLTNSSPHIVQVKDNGKGEGNVVKSHWHDLKELIENAYHLSDLAKRFGVGLYAVAREIRKQGLRYPLSDRMKKKLGTNLAVIQNDLLSGLTINEIRRRHHCSEELLVLIQIDKPELSGLHRQSARKNCQEKHRRILSDFIANNPGASRSTIQNELPATYEYFFRTEKEWFLELLPDRRKAISMNSRPRSSKDWSQIDQKKANELKIVFAELYNSGDRPVWLTKHGMLKRIGFLQKYNFSPQRFPQTTEILIQNIETHDAFIARRLKWAMN